MAAIGWLSRAGVGWDISEKITFFLPFAILSVVAPFLLARRLLSSTRFAVLGALIYACNTHLLLLGTGDVNLAVASAIVPLVFWTQVLSDDSRPWRRSMWTGVALALVAAYDLRIAYLAVVVIVVRLVVDLASLPPKAAVRRLGCDVISGVVFIVLQLYWLLPVALNHGDARLPVYPGLFTSFGSLSHGVAATDPFWTGAEPSTFHSHTPELLAFAIPLVAFTVLLRRVRQPVDIWLVLTAILGAFLVKGTQAPFGELYQWLFDHVPGWQLFRDSSKFYWMPALSYSVLVPKQLRFALELLAERGTRRRLHMRAVRIGGGSLILGLSTVTVLVVATSGFTATSGALGGATVPTVEPTSFVQLSGLLEHDNRGSVVAWLGAATAARSEEGPFAAPAIFPIETTTHPLVQLSGEPGPTQFPTGFCFRTSGWCHADELSQFCSSEAEAFCYVTPDLFPYLLRELGFGYVVLPLGSGVGTLPDGQSSEDLEKRVRMALNAEPKLLGSGATSLAIWQVPSPQPLVSQARAVVSVAGDPSSTGSIADLLSLLNLPVHFGGTDPHDTAQPGNTLTVAPCVDGFYTVPEDGEYVVAGSKPDNAQGGQLTHLSRPDIPAIASTTFDGQALYGPRRLSKGAALPCTNDLSGGLLEWNGAARDALGGNPSPSVKIRDQDSENREVSGVGMPWLVVRSTFDSQWQWSVASQHVVIDGFLNGYLTTAPAWSSTVSYSLRQAERTGFAMSFVGLVLVVALTILAGPASARNPATSHDLAEIWVVRLSRVPMIAAYGTLLLGVLEIWVGESGLAARWPDTVATLPFLSPGGLVYRAAADSYFGWFCVFAVAGCLLHLIGGRRYALNRHLRGSTDRGSAVVPGEIPTPDKAHTTAGSGR